MEANITPGSFFEGNSDITPVLISEVENNITQNDIIDTLRRAEAGKTFSPADVQDDNNSAQNLSNTESNDNSYLATQTAPHQKSLLGQHDGDISDNSVVELLKNKDRGSMRLQLQYMREGLQSHKSISPEQRKYAESVLSRLKASNEGIENQSLDSDGEYDLSKVEDLDGLDKKIKEILRQSRIDPKSNTKLQLKPATSPYSILRNSPRKINISNHTLKTNPEIEESIVNDTVNPTKVARVMFSPDNKYYSPEGSFATSGSLLNTNSKSGAFSNSPSADRQSKEEISKSALNSKWKPQKESPTTDEPHATVHTENVTEDNKNSNKYDSDHSPNYESMPLYTRLFVDPQVPFVISLYVQLMVNLLLISVILYFICMFLLTIRTDINNKINSQLIEITQEISLCAREYERNHCSPEFRVPALEVACMTWEKCMKRDPKVVGRAKIGAETFAEILNGFIKPISWKSMIFISIGIIGSLVMNNFVFVSYRNYNSSLASQFHHGHHQQYNAEPEGNMNQSLDGNYQYLLTNDGNTTGSSTANNNNNNHSNNNHNNNNHSNNNHSNNSINDVNDSNHNNSRSFITTIFNRNPHHRHLNTNQNNSNRNSSNGHHAAFGTPVAASSFFNDSFAKNDNQGYNNNDNSNFATPFKSSLLNTSLSLAYRTPIKMTPKFSPSVSAMLRHRNRSKKNN